MDSHVYLRGVGTGALEKLLGIHLEDQDKLGEDREEGVIRAVAVTTGEYDAVVFVEAGDLDRIQRVVLDRIRQQAGALGTETYIALEAPPEISGAAVAVFWDLFHKLPGNPSGPGLQGEALTTGPWDILVELGANTHTDLSRFILAVRGWPAVIDSSAAEATITGSP